MQDDDPAPFAEQLATAKQQQACPQLGQDQLPEDPHRGEIEEEWIGFATLPGAGQNHSGGEQQPKPCPQQSLGQLAALRLDPEPQGMCRQQVEHHSQADQPAAGERKGGFAVVPAGERRPLRKKRAGKEDLDLDVGHHSAEIVLHHRVNVVLGLGQRASQHDKDAQREQEHRQLERSQELQRDRD